MSALARTSVRVVVTLRDGVSVEHHELDVMDGLMTIGRDVRCTLPLATGFASRQHAHVDVRGTLMTVRDASMNGTHVGSALVKRSEVSVPYGTPIGIGPYLVVLERADMRGLLPGPRPRPRPTMTASTVVPVPSKPLTASGERPCAEAWAEENALRTEIHRLLLEHLDLATIDREEARRPVDAPEGAHRASRASSSTLAERIPADIDRDVLIGELADEALGLGPLERFLADPNDQRDHGRRPEHDLHRAGRQDLARRDARFTDDERVRAVIERIVTPLGRRIDESSPLVDARLKDGSRVNAVIRPLALRGSCITIRKFAQGPAHDREARRASAR